MFDYPVFAQWFGQSVPPAPSYLDINGDGGISVFDWGLLATNFGKGVTLAP